MPASLDKEQLRSVVIGLTALSVRAGKVSTAYKCLDKATEELAYALGKYAQAIQLVDELNDNDNDEPKESDQ